MNLLPELTPENTAFWTGGRDGNLLIMHCEDCDHAIHPPQLICPVCLCQSVAPRSALGTGRVVSFTVNHQPWLPGQVVPSVIGIVELDGESGVRITGPVLVSDPQDAAIDLLVEVVFEQIDDVWLPRFKPIAV